MIFDAGARRWAFAMFTSAGAALGCTNSSEPVPLVWVGHPGDGLPATVEGGVFSVQADVNGAPGPQVIVDTGSPFALLNVEAFKGAVALGQGRVAALTLGGTTLWKVPTVGVHGDSVLASSDTPTGGILGFSVFGQFAMSFNYRDARVTLGDAPLPDSLQDPISFAMSLEGGGPGRLPDGSVLDLAPSRIVVSGTVEGAGHVFLLDTGASWVALRSDIFQSIASDGRQTAKASVSLVTGSSMSTVLRLRTVVVDSAEVSGPVAVSGTGIDDLLAGLTLELSHPIDGLLGAPFLQQFYVTIDYPGRRVLLRRYTTEAHIVDQYHRVGILLQTLVGNNGSRVVVFGVVPGSDADRQGIQSGDTLIAIDGASLSDIGAESANRLLFGAIGATHVLQFVNRTVTVKVDELLPAD